MPERDPIVALSFACANAGLLDQFVQQCAAPRAEFTIHDPDTSSRQVLGLQHVFWVSWRYDQSLFPSRKRHHDNLLVRKLLTDIRHVELARSRIFEMRSRDVNLSFLEP